MSQMQPDEDNADAGKGGSRSLLRASAYAVGSLIALGGVLYAVFWSPCRDPARAVPRTIEILPLAEERLTIREIAEPAANTWVDRQQGIVRIPLEEAIEVVAKTLPTRLEADRTLRQREQRKIPTDAGSGRYPRPEERSPWDSWTHL